MTSLPSFFVLPAASGGPYLCPMPSGLLQYDEADIFSPRVKFTFQQSKTENSNNVHIRSCYNNKYWVAHDNKGPIEIVASANKPEEDETNPACTLFRVSSHFTLKGTPYFKLYNINKSLFAMYFNDGVVLSINTENKEIDNFHVVNWEKLVILPSQVSFQSEFLKDEYAAEKKRYLCCLEGEDRVTYHRFQSTCDNIGDLRAGYELIPTRNGDYRIKSLHNGKYWRKGNKGYIVADVEENSSLSDDTVFSFIKIRGNVFALRYLGNNMFCGANYEDDYIRPGYSELKKEARLIVEERVVQKKISHVRYRRADAFIFNEEVQASVNVFVTNESPDEKALATIEHSQEETSSYTWNNSVSVSVGTSVTTSASVELKVAPISFSTQIQYSLEGGYSYEWGRANEKSDTVKTSDAITVKPKTTMEISLMFTRSACDVPFSYTEEVLLPNGKWVPREKDDGIFKGVKTFNFYLNSKEIEYNPSLGKLLVPGQNNPTTLNN